MPTPALQSQAIIVGGGIGGLTTAVALARNGIRSLVLERSTFADETGAGIQLGPNATRILGTLGVLGEVENCGFKPESLQLYDGVSGGRLASVPLGRVIEERYGAPYVTCHRADLHSTLLAACRTLSEVELQDDFEVTEATSFATHVEAKGLDGRAYEGASLVAADGIWSRLRSELTPEVDLRFYGATAWRALLPRDRVPPPFDAASVGLWLGPRSHLVHYPVHGGRDLNIVAVVEYGAAKQGWSLRAETDVLLALFRHWTKSVQDLLAHVQAWRCWSLFRLKPLASWTEGRIALLGDAAHPVLPYLGQGAGLAIEDAATLAASLEACGGDPLQAFPRYQSLRLERATLVQAQAARLSRLYHLGGASAFARNLVLKLRRSHSLLQDFDWLYGDKQS
jgi:3-hydroxybenzoate 6-monooxygenase